MFRLLACFFSSLHRYCSQLNASGNTLVFSGGSAGGVGVFTMLDHVASVLPDVHVVGGMLGLQLSMQLFDATLLRVV